MKLTMVWLLGIWIILTIMLNSCATLDKINEQDSGDHCYRVCMFTTNLGDRYDSRKCFCRLNGI